MNLAALIRRSGIGVELFPEPKKLGQQLQYADKRGFRVAIVAGSRELDAGTVQLKNLAAKSAEEVPLTESGAELLAALTKLLASE